MERSGVLSSAASGSDGVSQTENDDTLSETGSEEETLNLVEDVILRTLKRYSSQQQQQQPDAGSSERRAEDQRRVGRFNNDELQSADSVNGPAAQSSSPEDKEMLANLLEEVHSLRRNQRYGSRRLKETSPSEVRDIHKHVRRFDRRRGKDKKSSSPTSEELRVTLEAATMAAKAAADASEAVLESVAKSTEAIDFIVNSMKTSKMRPKNATASDERRDILNAHRITHWVLGFMVVSTFVWRYGVVKAVKGFTSKFNDPFKFVGQLVGGKDDDDDDEDGDDNLLDKLAQVPSMLQNDSDDKDPKAKGGKGGKPVQPNGKPGEKESFFDKLNILQNNSDGVQANSAQKKKGKETKKSVTKTATAVDVKAKKAGEEVQKTAFSFANLFQEKPQEGVDFLEPVVILYLGDSSFSILQRMRAVCRKLPRKVHIAFC